MLIRDDQGNLFFPTCPSAVYLATPPSGGGVWFFSLWIKWACDYEIVLTDRVGTGDVWFLILRKGHEAFTLLVVTLVLGALSCPMSIWFPRGYHASKKPSHMERPHANAFAQSLSHSSAAARCGSEPAFLPVQPSCQLTASLWVFLDEVPDIMEQG